MTVAATVTMTHSHGVSGGAETLRLWANHRHTLRPSTIPSGAPTASAASAIVEACQLTVARSCRREKPRVPSRASSRRRSRTEVSKRWLSAAKRNQRQHAGHGGGNDAYSVEVADLPGWLLVAHEDEGPICHCRRLELGQLAVERGWRTDEGRWRRSCTCARRARSREARSRSRRRRRGCRRQAGRRCRARSWRRSPGPSAGTPRARSAASGGHRSRYRRRQGRRPGPRAGRWSRAPRRSRRPPYSDAPRGC